MLAASLRSVIRISRVEMDGNTIQVEAEGTAISAACPACGQVSHRIHDRYCRRPADLPWRGCAVRLVITVRSFCCDYATCPRATFVESFGEDLPRRARWTREAAQFLQHVADVTGGEAGARVAAAVGVSISPDTLLRMQHDKGCGAAVPAPQASNAPNDGRPCDGRSNRPGQAVVVRHHAVPGVLRSTGPVGVTTAQHQLPRQPRVAGRATS